MLFLLFQSYIVETWKRLCQMNPAPQENGATTPVVGHDFDDFLTEMFGGSLTSPCASSGSSKFMEQLKAVDVGMRQPHDFDVWQYWVNRKNTHPELYAVAMVVLATPATQVTVERAFSALALVLTSHRSTIGEETLENILSIKLNKDLYEKLLPNLYNWKEAESLLGVPSASPK